MPDDRTSRARDKINGDDSYESGRQFLDEQLAPLRPRSAAESAPASPDSTGPTQKWGGRN